jgi:Sigma-70, region 4
VQRRRDRLVRRLRGCLDALHRLQRTTLILRHGVGPLPRRTVDEAARLLDLPRGRVRLLERRGLRGLAGIGSGESCEGTGLARTTLVAIYDLLTGPSTDDGAAPSALVAVGVRVANAATVALDEGTGAMVGADEGSGAVASVRESGDARRSPSSDPAEDGPVASAGPSLGDPFGDGGSSLDNPFFLVLLAIVVACLAFAASEIRRAVR